MTSDGRGAVALIYWIINMVVYLAAVFIVYGDYLSMDKSGLMWLIVLILVTVYHTAFALVFWLAD